MESSYKKITLNSTDETLIAMLSMEFPFDSFEENEDHVIGYINKENLNEETENSIDFLINQYNVDYKWEDIEDQNWNELWESNFQPVEIEKICRIRAEFHSADDTFPYEIVIQPKMAFGTGHHQTTYMMIKAMNEIEFKSKSVFDYGCGTGILAIFASMLGADPIDAVDIEKESYLNTIENAERNGIKNIQSIEGDIHICPKRTYDVILANINRNILLDSAEDLAEKCHSGSKLLLSGILMADVEIITTKYVSTGFQFESGLDKENWACLKFIKL